MKDLVYTIQTPRKVMWSSRKMTAQYEHVKYSYSDNVRWKEMPKKRLSRFGNRVVEELV